MFDWGGAFWIRSSKVFNRKNRIIYCYYNGGLEWEAIMLQFKRNLFKLSTKLVRQWLYKIFLTAWKPKLLKKMALSMLMISRLRNSIQTRVGK